MLTYFNYFFIDFNSFDHEINTNGWALTRWEQSLQNNGKTNLNKIKLS